MYGRGLSGGGRLPLYENESLVAILWYFLRWLKVYLQAILLSNIVPIYPKYVWRKETGGQ